LPEFVPAFHGRNLKSFPLPLRLPFPFQKGLYFLVFIYIFFLNTRDKRDRERIGLREGIERKREDSVKGERKREREGERKREKRKRG